jgi:galactose mutarotase-like enzyme
MFFLENQYLKIRIANIGAELQSVYSKVRDVEYIWHGESGIYKKHAPNLFPFIGNIKNEKITYDYKNKLLTLPMPKHGFAKDLEFQVIDQGQNFVVLQLEDNETTKTMYPYDFSFAIRYELNGESLIQSYLITNRDAEKMPYHVGAHTAFSCELSILDQFEDYYLQFKDTLCFAYNMDEAGNYLNHIKTFLDLPEKMYLEKENFKRNAYVLDDIRYKKVTLKCNNHQRGVQVDFSDFPLLTLWTPQDRSSFICIEPWAGITDFAINTGNAEDKSFINILNPGESKQFTQKFLFF